MTDGMDDRRSRLAATITRFVSDAQTKAARIAQLLPLAIQEKDAPQRDALLFEGERLAHGLAGAGGTMGFPGVSHAAVPVERFFLNLRGRANLADASIEAQGDLLVRALCGSVSGLDPAKPLERLLPAATSAGGVSPKSATRQDRGILLLEDDDAVAAEMAEQLEHFGYTVKVAKSLGEADALLKEFAPQAMIVDLGLPEGPMAGLEVSIRVPEHADTPFVVLSARGDLPARLAAVRAGAAAYFTKPVPVGSLLDALDSLIFREASESYRILIVDDDPLLAHCYADILNQAGMITQVVNEPLQVMEPVEEFRPDLILLDLHMPKCTGLELAAVLRQQDAYVGIPVVFLSTETSISGHLAAMTLGGDDFLMKPVQPDYLVTAVSARIARARVLRSMISRDSLTGLLNHTHIVDQLDMELSRAQRYNTPLAFVMIDIDYFKRVNDTYGHAAGDRVLQSLARLMRQRFRRSDYIGRYGGEEFAIILPQTDEIQALRLVDELRIAFMQIEHATDKANFRCTFSAGISTFPGYDDAHRLAEAADERLYAAKHAGRNRVFRAGDK